MLSLLESIEKSLGRKIRDPKKIKEIRRIEKDTAKLIAELRKGQRLTSKDLNLIVY